uniref:Aldehyde dehydrogenase n=1 Tax=Opuntia streptacantha TaxID=393608 RepID=A0A7C9CL25_OPUST
MAEVERDVEELRECFRSGKTKEASWRRSQLEGLRKFVSEREDDILRALKLDLGKHPIEAFRDEVGTLLKDINVALDNLASWMRGQKIKLPLPGIGTKVELVAEPLGVVLIISTWNFPFGLSLEPLIGAIAAGCAAVLKPSELAPASAALLADAIPAYVDARAIKIVQGGHDVSDRLLQFKWDKIFFTGSSQVGRIVMTAAAKHLTPVTLELGGKCPAIVDSLPTISWRREIVLKRMIAGKFGTCSGQACIAIDYILVQKEFAQTLVESLKGTIKSMLGEKSKETISRIVNKCHFKRLMNLLDEPGVKKSIVYGGSTDEDKLYIEPTILLDPPIDAAIMKDEIFGPLLPIITLENIEQSIEFINSRPKPLSIYCFTNDDHLMQRLAKETSSGALMSNDAIIQYLGDMLPFGGVGESGFGRYHGKFSFDTFSHEKPVIRRSIFPDFWFRYPPWNDLKLALFRASYAFKYFEVFLLALGLKKPRPFLSKSS